MSLIYQSATEIQKQQKLNDITPLDLLDAVEERIGVVEPDVNALPTLCFDRARAQAKQLMEKPVSERGMLAGLPVAIKDLDSVAGVRTTFGSTIFSDFVPTESDCLVDMLEAEGGIPYAKTNTPEFGAGANTFNEVFGRTLNPWDTTKSCAGSSGGSAVALATGTAWLATGSDLGGSLRNPASFCSIVGFRPSAGRVAHGGAGPGASPEGIGGLINQPFGVSGPMARNVPDVALLLDSMSGVHPSDPLSMPREAGSFLETVELALKSDNQPLRIAFSADFGITPVDPEIASIVENAAKQFESLGCHVEHAHPDFTDAEDIFQTNRAIMFYTGQHKLLETAKDQLKPEVVWNIEKARQVSLDDISRVESARAAYLGRATQFFKEYDLLLSPATIVPPFPVEQRFVESCEGVAFDNYIQWCSIAYAITNTGFPAMSVPAGFTESGMPVGMQIVAGPRQERALLCAAARFEAQSGLKNKIPLDPITPSPNR